MRRAGLSPDVMSFSAVISAYEKGCQHVAPFLHNIRRLAFWLHVVSFSGAISAYEKDVYMKGKQTFVNSRKATRKRLLSSWAFGTCVGHSTSI